MPITPKFVLSQTDSHVILDIHVPHIRVSAESVQVALTTPDDDDDNNNNNNDSYSVLHFAALPCYLLVLKFEHSFHTTTESLSNNSEEACATYRPEIHNGMIRLELRKATSEYWPDLDLLGKLKQDSKKPTRTSSRWIREILQDEEEDDDNEDQAEGQQERTDVPPAAEKERTLGYGFLRMFRGVFSDLTRDGLAKEMFERPFDEDDFLRNENVSSTFEERREQRRIIEDKKFNAERYLQDLDVQDDYIYQCAMAMQPHWHVTPSLSSSSSSSNDGSAVKSISQKLEKLSVDDDDDELEDHSIGQKDESFFTEQEQSQLMAIPYPLLPQSISADEQDGLLLGLADILFAYVYDHLLTDGEPTVESAWTISILSATLSWLEDFQQNGGNVKAVVHSSIRRALLYPYLRNLDLAVHVWRQVATILRRGVRCVIRCLLQVRAILDHSELYYLGNKLYLDPYLSWMQANATKLHGRHLTMAAGIDEALRNCQLKHELGLNLVALEESAWDEEEEEEDEECCESEESAAVDDSSGSLDEDDEATSTSSDSDTSERSTLTPQSEREHSSELLDSNIGLSVLKISPSLGSGEHEIPKIALYKT